MNISIHHSSLDNHGPFQYRGSISSYSKVSRNNSFRFDPGNAPAPPQVVAKKDKPSMLKNLMSNLKQKSEEDQMSSSGSVLERMTSKSSRKSGLSVSNMEDTVKFKLVEDLSLVTIPITTCLLVLLGYILVGAALFSAWEVDRETKKRFHVIVILSFILHFFRAGQFWMVHISVLQV